MGNEILSVKGRVRQTVDVFEGRGVRIIILRTGQIKSQKEQEKMMVLRFVLINENPTEVGDFSSSS